MRFWWASRDHTRAANHLLNQCSSIVNKNNTESSTGTDNLRIFTQSGRFIYFILFIHIFMFIHSFNNSYIDNFFLSFFLSSFLHLLSTRNCAKSLDIKEGNVLFNDALNTFYLRLYGVGDMVKDHSDSERANPQPFAISSKGSFICAIP